MRDELLQELKEAMKEKDDLRKNTITMLRAAILQVEKDELKTLTEEEMHALVAKEVKKRKEAISDYEKGGREDIVENLNKEIEILSKYLPKQLSKDETESLVFEAITAVNAMSAKDMGKVMQYLRPKTAGKVDGKLLSDIVKDKLSNI